MPLESDAIGEITAVIHKIVPTLVREMGQAYPELVHGETMITETVRLADVETTK